MSLIDKRVRLPALVVAVITLAFLSGLVGGALSAPKLPPVGAGPLAVSAARAATEWRPLSGEFRTHLDLGIPALPDTGGADVGGLAQLLSGDREFRLWRSRDGFRIAEMLPAAERAFIVGRSGAWTWDSEKFEATHVSVDGAASKDKWPVGAVPQDRRPLQFLGAIARRFQGTDSTVRQPERVAGRPAYVIVTEPDDPKTLVGRVEMAVDSATRTPLAVDVYPRGSGTPAISAGFTDIDFGPIDPSTFDFEPPSGAIVREGGHGQGVSRRDADGSGRRRDDAGEGKQGALVGEIRKLGRGWSQILAVRVDELPARTRSLLPFSGTLLSAALVERGDDAWLLTGAVPQDEIRAAATKLP
ncbi:MAG: hypothetical protein H0U16_10315 [Actinobacteria bacterium]|nr:hypothetical protein [Actinomycetota bacterium]